MPLNSETLPTDTREHFCLALKAARERAGISLDEIEKATKIPAYMFAALERCDLRRWPHGLFRRSFFRDYVKMIGVPVAEACAAFVQLFVDEEDVVAALHEVKDSPGEVQGGSGAVPAGSGPAPKVSRAVQGGFGRLEAGPALARVRDALVTAWRQGSEAVTSAIARFDGDTNSEEPPNPQRAWVSDARRVGDAPPPRFRVRIKIQR